MSVLKDLMTQAYDGGVVGGLRIAADAIDLQREKCDDPAIRAWAEDVVAGLRSAATTMETDKGLSKR